MTFRPPPPNASTAARTSQPRLRPDLLSHRQAVAGKVGYSSLLPPVVGGILTCMRTVLIVLFDGVQSLDVTGPLEVFAGANRWQSGRDHRPAGPNGPDGPAYRIRTASLGGRPVRTSSGLRLAPDKSLGQDESSPDVLLVPGGEGTRDAG